MQTFFLPVEPVWCSARSNRFMPRYVAHGVHSGETDATASRAGLERREKHVMLGVKKGLEPQQYPGEETQS